jgi:thiol-disulfide isomerase/thioredoxin
MARGERRVSVGVRRPASVAALSALALVLAACGSAVDETAASDPTSSAADGDSPDAVEGGHPLSFQAVTTDGADFDASELAGQDVVLWFWAPWCTICRSEAPSVAAAATQLDGSVEIVGVASSGTLEEMQAFVDETGAAAVTHVADVPGDVWRQFGVVAQPTFVFVNDDGRTQTFAGGLSQAALVDAMEQLADV